MDIKRRDELKLRLRQKLNEVSHTNKHPTRKEIIKQNNELGKEFNEVMRDPRVTIEMMSFYTTALMEYKNANIPNPKVVLDNVDKYKKEYGEFVLNIVKEAKEKNWGVELVKSMLNNKYTAYMTKMLDLPPLPSFVQ